MPSAWCHRGTDGRATGYSGQLLGQFTLPLSSPDLSHRSSRVPPVATPVPEFDEHLDGQETLQATPSLSGQEFERPHRDFSQANAQVPTGTRPAPRACSSANPHHLPSVAEPDPEISRVPPVATPVLERRPTSPPPVCSCARPCRSLSAGAHHFSWWPCTLEAVLIQLLLARKFSSAVVHAGQNRAGLMSSAWSTPVPPVTRLTSAHICAGLPQWASVMEPVPEVSRVPPVAPPRC